ncbi:MAG TPA: hypothetical protein VJ813_07315 [Vicinamibacterales bacterium]|nr:hypothetical protein [Vicinamibacterales bacterium]
MKKWLVSVAVVFVCLTAVHADVTVVQTMKMEGAAAQAMGGAPMPRITMRIKGQKSRAEIDTNGQVVTSIVDLAARQVIVLNSTTKTATVTTPASVAAGGAPVAMPKMDISLKPTGKTQTIDGQQCEEHVMAMSMAMAQFMGQGQVPPEAAAMMQDVKMVMDGSVWIARSAPGAAEFTAFNKAAINSNLLNSVAGLMGGKSGGLDKLMEAAAAAPGLPYLTEITMSFEGTGPMVDAMKQMGPMKMIQTLASVSTDPIADDLFTIPAGYTVEKK